MNARSLLAEVLGTALLVFLGVGTATLSFGFKITGTSTSAGVVATALAFGLVLMAMVYAIGPISGCHINPAVTIGFLVARRISLSDAAGYWLAQFVGAIAGAAALYGVVHGASSYTRSMGLGTDGYGSHSMVGLNAGGAIGTEVILTFVFVLVILAVTRRASNATVAGLVIGLTLALVHIIGIPLDGTSVNPAAASGPALFVRGDSLSQLWVFILAPLIGGALAASPTGSFYPDRRRGGRGGAGTRGASCLTAATFGVQVPVASTFTHIWMRPRLLDQQYEPASVPRHDHAPVEGDDLTFVEVDGKVGDDGNWDLHVRWSPDCGVRTDPCSRSLSGLGSRLITYYARDS